MEAVVLYTHSSPSIAACISSSLLGGRKLYTAQQQPSVDHSTSVVWNKIHPRVPEKILMYVTSLVFTHSGGTHSIRTLVYTHSGDCLPVLPSSFCVCACGCSYSNPRMTSKQRILTSSVVEREKLFSICGVRTSYAVQRASISSIVARGQSVDCLQCRSQVCIFENS